MAFSCDDNLCGGQCFGVSQLYASVYEYVLLCVCMCLSIVCYYLFFCLYIELFYLCLKIIIN